MLKMPDVSYMEVMLPFSLWILGIALVFTAIPTTDIVAYEIFPPVEELQHNGFLFDTLKLFFNNLLVGFFLAYVGYFTFGLFSIFVSLWNGIMLGSIIFDFLKIFTLNDLFLGMLHAPLEILALSIFAGIGLRNFWIIDDLIKNQKLKLKNIPGLKELFVPTLLLTVSSIIEVYINS